MSQFDVALILGISNHMVSKYETGYHQPPLEIIVQFAKLYGTTTNYLLGLEPYITIVLDNQIPPEQEKMICQIIDVMSEYYKNGGK